MDVIIKWLGEEALKAGGFLAFVGAGIMGALAWPQDCPSAGERAREILGSASPSTCKNAFGNLSPDVADQVLAVVGFGALGAIAGALIAALLVAFGLFSRDDLGIPS